MDTWTHKAYEYVYESDYLTGFSHIYKNILILREDNNTSENFESHENKESILEKQDIKKNHKNLVGKFKYWKPCNKWLIRTYSSKLAFYK